VRLRLWHADDGTRVAYREAGAGPGLVLLHSALLTHREWEPAVEHLTHRFRLVLPDLPLHGDSEDRPRHPYSLPWYAGVIRAFCEATAGPRPLVAGHGMGAEVLLHAVTAGGLAPERLVLMPNRMHGPATGPRRQRAWAHVARAGALPGVDRALGHAARATFRPDWGEQLSARGNPAARDLVRHAFADVGGDATRARAWARHARRWPSAADPALLEAYATIACPVLLLWGDADRQHPPSLAEEALTRLPDGLLRVLPGAGYLLAYDDPVGVARELIAFCGRPRGA
jgi:pimeloyl-ACP methyl ester carboxylesterase